ncbi:MAG: response regulator [Chlamydiota bacterium]|nr:response regulator [Chlamydiota bacterium]
MNEKESSPNKATIAIIDDDRDIVEVTSAFLMRHGYKVIKAYEGITGIEMIKDLKPDLILLDLMLPGMDGYEICRRIKEDSHLWHVPVIYFTAKGATSEKISGLTSGADDYVTKPFEPGELLARIQSLLSRISQVLDANPLSKLPGNHSIQMKISQTLSTQKTFAICHLDIDHFKSFNDQYGFHRGDQAIRKTGQILISTVQERGATNDFVGHIGGDDFVVISTPDKIDLLCSEIIRKFDHEAPLLYDKEDRERGFITLRDRRGMIHEFPIMSLSIAVISNEKRNITHIAEVNAIAVELKKYAKSLPGSNYVKDRRKEGPSNTPTTDVPERGITTNSSMIMDEISILLNQKKLNIFLQPLINVSNNTVLGYEAIARGSAKNVTLKQEDIFAQAINMKCEKEIAELYFEKLNVFFYGLKDPLWISGWLHPKVLSKILIEEPTLWDQFQINNSFVLQIKAEDLVQYEQIMKDILALVLEYNIKIAIIPPVSAAMPLSILSKIKPAWIHLKEDILNLWKADPSQEFIIKALTDMSRLFGGETIISGVDDPKDIQTLRDIGIIYMSGSAIQAPNE